MLQSTGSQRVGHDLWLSSNIQFRYCLAASQLKFMSFELVMLSSHLILYHPLLLMPSIFPRARIFSNETALCIRVAKVVELQVQHQSLLETDISLGNFDSSFLIHPA